LKGNSWTVLFFAAAICHRELGFVLDSIVQNLDGCKSSVTPKSRIIAMIQVVLYRVDRMWQQILKGLPRFLFGIPCHVEEGDTLSKFMPNDSAHVVLSRRLLCGSGMKQRWWRQNEARSFTVL
jgi:hypothetical protein